MYCHIHHCHYHHCHCVPTDSTEKGGALTQEELLAYTQEMKDELKDYTVDLKDQIFSYIDIGVNPVEIANTFASLKEQDTYILRTLTNKIDELNNTTNLSMFNLRTRVTDLEGQSATIIQDLVDRTERIEELEANTQVVESVAELDTINNPKDGLRVYVKSYHAGLGKGGGYFTYDSTKSTENDGGVVINGWVRELNGFVSPEMFGAVGDAITEESDILQQCSNAAKGLELPIVGESLLGYHINNNVTIYDDFKVAAIYFKKNSEGVNLIFDSKQESEKVLLSSTQLEGLSCYSNKISGFSPDMVGRYLKFSSDTAVLTERYNQNETQYYYKNTCVFLVNSQGDINPSLDMDLTERDSIYVEVRKPEKLMEVYIGFVGSLGDSGTSNVAIYNKRDNVHIHIDSSDRNAGWRSLLVNGGNNCTITGTYQGATWSGLGYNIRMLNCCDTLLKKVISTNGRKAVDGNYSANVTIEDCVLGQVDSHWGNNLKINRSTVEGVGWSGKDVTITNSTLTRAVTVRVDVHTALGTLYIDTVELTSSVLLSSSSTPTVNVYSSPRTFFDKIIVKNINVTSTVPTVVLINLNSSGSGLPQVPIKMPRVMEIENVTYLNGNVNVAIQGVTGIINETLNYKISNIKTTNQGLVSVEGRANKLAITEQLVHGIDFKISDINLLRFKVDAGLFERVSIKSCGVESLNRVNTTIPLKNSLIECAECSFDTTIVPFGSETSTTYALQNEADKGFINCSFKGTLNVYNPEAQGEYLYNINPRIAGTVSGSWGTLLPKRNSGTTSQRPIESQLTEKDIGFKYFDTTLNKPVYWTGSEWVDSTGVEV